MQFQDVPGGCLGVFWWLSGGFPCQKSPPSSFYDILVIQSGLIVNT